jgi:hypothetical protein
MEGDKPTGCMVLVKYVQLKATMATRLKKMHENDPLYPMVDVMLSKIVLYLDEALECDTLVLAAIFHPGLRVKFFEHAFGNGSNQHRRAEDLLESAFILQRDSPDHQVQENNVSSPINTSNDHEGDEGTGSDFLNFYTEVVTSSKLNELERYLQGIDPMVSPDMNNPQCALDWWRVSFSFLFLFCFCTYTNTMLIIYRLMLVNTQYYQYWPRITWQLLQRLLHPNDPSPLPDKCAELTGARWPLE